jgi:rSAM/selenodomain-associated transferase 1
MHVILDPKASQKVSPNLCALGIMTKAPRPGKVKTRLTPPLTSEQAAQLNTCFLRDLSMSILHATTMSPAKGIGVYTPIGMEAAYETILPPEFFLVPQRGDDFGERLIFAAEDLFALGFQSVCLINSDSPTVPAESFAEAAIELADPRDRLVLGPSDDGGYYLIGLKQMHRRLFEQIDWSTERVFAQTKERAAELGLQVHELASGLDVDDRASLEKLKRELFQRAETPARDVAVETRKFLEKLQHA